VAISGAAQAAGPSFVGVSRVGFFISVIGLAVQGLAGLAMYGPALATESNGIPNDVSAWLSANIAPITPSALWSLVIAFTIGIFVIGLVGLYWLRSNRTTRIRFGAALVLVSAVLAATTAWGFGIGSLLMLVGLIMAFRTIHRSTVNRR
jgi:flavodoxin